MKKVPLLSIILALAVAAFTIGSCKSDNNNPPVVKPTLYDSLGGTTLVADPANAGTTIEKGRLGIRSVIDSTIFVIAGDSLLSPYFTVLLTEVGSGNFTGFTALSKNLTDFVAVATGAKDYTYSGKSMTAAHDPATNPRMAEKADNAAFDEFIVDLVKGAKKNNLPDNLIGSVGALVETLRSSVVQR